MQAVMGANGIVESSFVYLPGITGGVMFKVGPRIGLLFY